MENSDMRRFWMWLLDLRRATLWHPDSPGVRVVVIRSRLGRLLKPTAFATTGEVLESEIVWEELGPDES